MEKPAQIVNLFRVTSKSAGLAAAILGVLVGFVLVPDARAMAADTHVVVPGHHAAFSADLDVEGGSPCVVSARPGRGSQVVLKRFTALRHAVRIEWMVPSDAKSATWNVRLICSSQVEATDRFVIAGNSPARSPRRLASGSPRVSQKGALLVAPVEPTEEQPPSSRGCPSPSSTGFSPSAYNTTPPGELWQVPKDPCNTEGRNSEGSEAFYANCAYWAAEKRPDVWVEAVWKYGYAEEPGGAWNIEVDAAKAGLPIDHVPSAGDLAVWPDNAIMGRIMPWSGIGGVSGSSYASPGGHVAYVEAVEPNGIVIISQMGYGADETRGDTMALEYTPEQTFFIHRH
jgi:surface antigen